MRIHIYLSIFIYIHFALYTCVYLSVRTHTHTYTYIYIVKFSMSHVVPLSSRFHNRTVRICRAPLSYQTEFGSGATTVAPYRDFAVPAQRLPPASRRLPRERGWRSSGSSTARDHFVEEPISPEEFYGALGNQRW
jgi:hypothetical protein